MSHSRHCAFGCIAVWLLFAASVVTVHATQSEAELQLQAHSMQPVVQSTLLLLAALADRMSAVEYKHPWLGLVSIHGWVW